MLANVARMSSVTHPRGRLPQRVYWTRRALVIVLALLLVFAIGKLLGGSPDPGPGKAARTSASTKTSSTSTPTAAATRSVTKTPVADPKTGTSKKGSAKKGSAKTKAPLAVPTGLCADDDVTVTPAIFEAAAGGKITIGLDLTGATAACTWTVSPRTVVLKISSGKDRIWSSQDCGDAIPTKAVTVRSAEPTRVNVAWNGRRSNPDCDAGLKWAEPGYYHAVAAAYGSSPTDAQFRLTLPKRPVVTKTAKPKTSKTAKPKTTH